MPDKTYTETEHIALVADAVQRETADLRGTTDGLRTEASTKDVRITTLEAEVAAEKQSRETAEAALATFKEETAEQAAVLARKDTRMAAIKTAAPQLADDYFTPERADTWAAMSDDVFAALVDGLTAAAPAKAKTEEVVTTETAAFKGGTSPSSNEAKGSTFTQWLTARRGESVAS